MSAGPFAMLTGYYAPPGTQASLRDDTILLAPGRTAGLLDFVGGWGKPPSTPVSEGTQTKNYVDGAAPGIIRGLPAFGGPTGIDLAGSTAKYIEIPKSMWPNVLTNPIYTLWFTAAGISSVGFNNRLIDIRQGNRSIFTIIPITSSQSPTYPIGLEIIYGGIDINLNFNGTIQKLFDQKLHQLGCELVPSLDGTMELLRLYIDGAVWYETGYVAKVARIAPVASDLGVIGGFGYQGTIYGQIYRFRLDDPGIGDPEAGLKMIKADYTKCISRFSTNY